MRGGSVRGGGVRVRGSEVSVVRVGGVSGEG